MKISSSRFNLTVTIPYILVLLCGLFWGLNFPLARMTVESGIHPIGLTFWQSFGGGMVLLSYCILSRRRIAFDKTSLIHALVIALCGTAIPSTIYFYAADHLPAGVLAITVALVPMATYALAWGIDLERINFWRVLGIILGLAAMIILMSPGAELPGAAATKWLLLALVSVLCYAFEDVYVDVRARKCDLVALLTLSLFVAALITAPLVYTQDAFYKIAAPFTKIDLAVVIIMVCSSVAYILFFTVIQIAGAVFASLVGYTITLSGVFWGILIFKEQHSLLVWVSLVLMLIGLGLVTPRKHNL